MTTQSTHTKNPPVVHVGNTDIAVIDHQNQRVIKTDLLAQVLGTEEIRIQQNFKRNPTRFQEGKHFFKLQGDELREFKRRLSERYSVEIAPNVNAIMLWTERGAARHAKFLDTDEAWDKFDLLESAYFDVKPPKNALRQLEPPTLTRTQQGELYNLVADKVRNGGKTNSYYWSKLLARFRVNSYKHIPAGQFDEAVEFLKRFEGSDDPLMMFTTASLLNLVQIYVDKAVAEHAREQPLHGSRMVVEFREGGQFTVQPLNPGYHVMTLDDFEYLHLRKLKEEGKAVVMQSAVDAIRAIANINLGA